MSDPNKIYVEYATRGLDKVIQSLKDIEDHVTRVQKKSAAAFKLQSSLKPSNKEVNEAVAGVTRATEMAGKAKRAGNKKAAAQAEQDAKNHADKLVTIAKQGGDETLAYYKSQDKKLRQVERDSAADRAAFHRSENKRLQNEQGNRLKAEREADKKYKNFSKGVDSRKEVSATYAGKFAEKQAKEEHANTLKAASVMDQINAKRQKYAEDAKKLSTEEVSEKKRQEAAVSLALDSFQAKKRRYEEEDRKNAEYKDKHLPKAQAKLERDIKRTQNSIIKGEGTFGAGMGPHARLRMLEKLRGSDNPDEIVKNIENVRDLADANAARGVRDAKRTKAAENEAKKRDKIRDKETANQKKNSDAQAREDKKSAKENKKKTDKVVEESNARIRAQAKERDRLIQRHFTQPIANGLAHVASKALSVAAAVPGKVVNTLLNAGGGFSVDQAVNERVSFERQSALVANKYTGASTEKVMSDARALSIRSGYDRNEIVATRGKYLDIAGPRNMKEFEQSNKDTEFFLKIAKASGATPEEVAAAGGLLKVQNRNLDSDGMRRLLLSTWDQGKRGSIDFDSMATALPNITKTANSYAGDWETNVRHHLGSAQVLRGSGSVAEAGTAISNIAMDAKFHKDEVAEYMGKNVFDANERLTVPIDELLAKIMEKTGGKESEIMKMKSGKGVIGRRAIKAFEGDAGRSFYEAKDNYLKTHKGDEAGANKAGADEFRKAFKNAIGDMDEKKLEADLNKDWANVMQTSAEKFEAAVRELKEQVGDKLVPVLLQLVPTLQQFIPVLASAIQTLGSIINAEAPNDIGDPTKVADTLTTQDAIDAKRKELAEAKDNWEKGVTKFGIGSDQAVGNLGAFAKDMVTENIWGIIADKAFPKEASKDSFVGRTRDQEAELTKKAIAFTQKLDDMTKALDLAEKNLASKGGGATPNVTPGAGPGTPVSQLPTVANPQHPLRGYQPVHSR